MANNETISSKIGQHKNILIILMVGFFIFELQLFAVTMMKSGRNAQLHIFNNSGELIFETNNEKLNKVDRYYFEKTFGPLKEYKKKLIVKNIPFPFRAWFTAAIGFPFGTVLIIAFIYKAYFALILSASDKDIDLSKKHNPSKDDAFEDDAFEDDDDFEEKLETRFFKILHKFENMNIFIIGFLVFIFVISYWIFPNAISFIVEIVADFIDRYRWFFLCTLLISIAIFIWIIYLKYRLAQKNIDAQVELRKYQYKLQLEQGLENKPQLGYNAETKSIVL